MGKKIGDLFDSRKFLSTLLILMVSTMLTGNYRLGSIEGKMELIEEKIELVDRINETQIGRTDEVECVEKIMKVMGCTIPENHP